MAQNFLIQEFLYKGLLKNFQRALSGNKVGVKLVVPY